MSAVEDELLRVLQVSCATIPTNRPLKLPALCCQAVELFLEVRIGQEIE